MKAVARYFMASALLGAGWFLVLLLPSWTRAWLLGDRRQILPNAALLVVSSVIVAWVFRGYISRASEFKEDLSRALVLPYAGCLIYLTLWNAVSWIHYFVRGGLNSVYETLILYPWGLGYALAACFVVIPYGLFCQHVMKRALAAP